MKIKHYFFLLLVAVLTSCELIFMAPAPGTSPKDIFNQVWQFTHDKYSFFEFKQVDWEKAKKDYENLITDSMGDEQLFKVCASMLYLLKDEHVNLISNFDISRNPEVMLDYPTNYFPDILSRYYFNNDRVQIYGKGLFTLFDFEDVLYVRYSSFINMVSEKDMDYILKKAESKKGLILDVRDNGGGALTNVEMLAKRFTETEKIVGYEMTKFGSGQSDYHNDTLKLKPHKVKSDSPSFTSKPVVVLTNRNCYSATNFFVLYVKTLPNVTIMGGRTGGGGGVPSTTELSNGWTLRVSSSRSFDQHMVNVENGIEPDIAVNITDADINSKIDSILDRALFLIRNGK
jgi:hypothetical protein